MSKSDEAEAIRDDGRLYYATEPRVLRELAVIREQLRLLIEMVGKIETHL